ncbi:MAG: universal stress protein [Gemmatimonadaceae bacterium]|nr:universal stress protein [Gemmatimonadaceae bacterium]
MSTTTTLATPAGVFVLEPTVLPDGPVLVATDTGTESDGALPLAASIASRANAILVALSVVEPAAVPIYGVDGMVVSMAPPEEALDTRLAAVREQLTRVLHGVHGTQVLVKLGEPARTVAETAASVQARLVIVGRGRHHGLDRMLGGEPVLRMLQLGDAPILAVAPTLTSPPRRVVIATDFSPFSLYAAQVALSVAAPDAHVWLLHVAPAFDTSVPYLQERAAQYREQADAGFRQMRDILAQGRVQFESVVLTGTATDALLAFAEEQRADLIASATHGYGFIRRMILGSVAASLIRHASCSVLVVPGSARTIATTRARSAPDSRIRAADTTGMDAELAAFTSVNAGRRCSVEVDDAELGAQMLGHELVLVGGTFDRHSGIVSLMFGASAARGLHMTHNIAGVTHMDVQSNAGGVDQVLRLQHSGGQTLVTLT